MPRSPSTDAHKPARSRFEDVLDAATDLFSEHGYSATTVRMIADRLGILSGSLYSHISGKEDILRAIAQQVGASFLERAQEAVGEIEDPEAALRAICGSHLRVLDEQQTAVTVYYNEWRRLESPAREQIVELRDRYEALIAAQVDAGMRGGIFSVPEPRVGVLMILSMLNWTYQWYQHGGPAGPDRLADLYMDAILAGLRSRD